MKKIKIFVAGSKDLKDERNAIIILANDLNRRFNPKGISVTIFSFEHFNDSQDEYNDFIEKEADIVIFIIDGKIGKITESEFNKASKTYLKENRPKIKVFLRHYDEITSDIRYIQGLVNAGLEEDEYYVDYSNLSDLKFKVYERIVNFIENDINKTDKKSVDSEKEKIKNGEKPKLFNKYKLIIGILSIIIVALTSLFCWSLFKSNDLLMFMGGGSVKNYLEDTTGIDILDYPNSIYINMASGSSWALLIEEANRYREDGGKGLEHVTSICLSADDIDSVSLINDNTRWVFENSRIVKYSLGGDSLKVFIHKDLKNYRHLESDNIAMKSDTLRKLVSFVISNPDKFRIFTTSPSSGTLRLYQSVFEEEDGIDLAALQINKKTHLFYQNVESAFINNLKEIDKFKPYFILGSEHYYPYTLKSEKEHPYFEFYITKDGNYLVKPMSLYFLVRKEGKERDIFTVKKNVVDFLKRIGAQKNLDPVIWDNLKKGKVRDNGKDLIIEIN